MSDIGTTRRHTKAITTVTMLVTEGTWFDLPPWLNNIFLESFNTERFSLKIIGTHYSENLMEVTLIILRENYFE